MGKVASFEEETLMGLDPGLDERDIRHLVALYDGEIAYADSQVGRLVTSSRERNRLDDTLLVLTRIMVRSFSNTGVSSTDTRSTTR